VGCSSSEVCGQKIGSSSSPETAAAIVNALMRGLEGSGIYLAAQCCEHLNRALIVEREAALRVFDLELDPAGICGASASVGVHLKAMGVDGHRASKAALLVEEALMVVYDRNSGKHIKAEVTVDLNDGLMLVLRDDGVIFDITDADARVSSLRSYLVSNLMTAIPGRRNLTTTGFNRNLFKL